MNEKIRRIETYDDERFDREVLNEHGCYIVQNKYPVEIKIISSYEAIIKGNKEFFDGVIEEFRFYSKHITTFYDKDGNVVKCFDRIDIFKIEIDRIQPLQFFVDENKLNAVKTFVRKKEDIIIPLDIYDGEYVCLDGHTRLFLAYKLGFSHVYGYITDGFEGEEFFVEETKKRGIKKAKDMALVSHDEYEIKWHAFCDDYYKNKI